MNDKCALRALTLCDGQVYADDVPGFPCFCRRLEIHERHKLEDLVDEVRWARAVEVARAQRDPDYVLRLKLRAARRARGCAF